MRNILNGETLYLNLVKSGTFGCGEKLQTSVQATRTAHSRQGPRCSYEMDYFSHRLERNLNEPNPMGVPNTSDMK